MSWIWIVFIDILLVIIIALFMFVTVQVQIGKELKLKIKYAGITVFSLQPETEQDKQNAAKKNTSAKKKNKQDVSVLKDKTADNKNKKKKKTEKKKNKPKKSLNEKLEMVKNLLHSITKPAKRLFRHIRVTDVNADIIVSGDDAAVAALNYGKMCVLINSVLALLYTTVQLDVKNIDLSVDFQSGKTIYDISFNVKLRVCTAIGCALWFLFRMAKTILAGSKKKGGIVKPAAKKGN